MTNDKADFTQGNILKKSGRIYDAGTRRTDPAGSLWCGRPSCGGKIWFHIRIVSGFHRKSGTESGYLCSDSVAMGITVLIARYLGEKRPEQIGSSSVGLRSSLP